MNGSYLVNIVANDFKDGLTIFEPFLLDQSTTATATATAAAETVVNGVKDAVNGITEGVKKVMNGDLNGHANVKGNGLATNGH
jgi:methylenetetrahydrofolate reductase (NADPH)